MDIFGIKFAPLNVPLHRRLQTLAASAWMITLIFGTPILWLLSLYLLICTKCWWMIGLYLIWIWVIDNESCETGGRSSRWVRSWAWWRYNRDYFPLVLKKLPGVDLDAGRNYLFCSFPHGLLCSGSISAFGNGSSGYENIFPHHTPHVVFLAQNYKVPFLRELLMSIGGISSSAKSINYVLSRPDGGHVCVIMVGGEAESYNCKPGNYTLVLKNRKGFVKLALKNGSPLVPVLSFGETDLYDQLDGPRLRYYQEKLRKWIGLPPVIPLGRGFFQYSFGLIPHRRLVTTVVGMPMEVPKIEAPTQEQIDEYHSKFIVNLTRMFEEQKYNYLDSPDDKHIVIN